MVEVDMVASEATEVSWGEAAAVRAEVKVVEATVAAEAAARAVAGTKAAGGGATGVERVEA